MSYSNLSFNTSIPQYHGTTYTPVLKMVTPARNVIDGTAIGASVVAFILFTTLGASASATSSLATNLTASGLLSSSDVQGTAQSVFMLPEIYSQSSGKVAGSWTMYFSKSTGKYYLYDSRLNTSFSAWADEVSIQEGVNVDDMSIEYMGGYTKGTIENFTEEDVMYSITVGGKNYAVNPGLTVTSDVLSQSTTSTIDNGTYTGLEVLNVTLKQTMSDFSEMAEMVVSATAEAATIDSSELLIVLATLAADGE